MWLQSLPSIFRKKSFHLSFLMLCITALSACSTIQRVVYRIDVPQGNYLEADQVAQVKKGLTKTQVQYLLGSPVLSTFNQANKWYYVFLQQNAYKKPVQHTLIVNFNNQGIVTSTELSKALPADPAAAVNNTVISTKTVEPSKGLFSW